MSDTKRIPRWPLFLIAAPAAVAVWSGWVSLGQLCGFGVVHPLPGIADGFTLNTAITLPVGVEAYGGYALRAWLTLGTSVRARAFAKWSAIGALILDMAGQAVSHQKIRTRPDVVVCDFHAIPLRVGIDCEPSPEDPQGTQAARRCKQKVRPDLEVNVNEDLRQFVGQFMPVSLDLFEDVGLKLGQGTAFDQPGAGGPEAVLVAG